jgi:hypothetical protein
LVDRFETLGNATIQLFRDGRPVLATDPWLIGTCYYGSWALDHPLTTHQIENVANSEYIWISHGHPDHLHEPSLKLLLRGKRILIGELYGSTIHDSLKAKGFQVTVLPYRQWRRLGPTLEVMCIDNMNQDSILVIRAGDALLLNINDSLVAGELRFLRRLVAHHPNEKTYCFALCSIDADMFNFVDRNGHSLVRPPVERKPLEVHRVARLAKALAVRNFCCSSSQHVYARVDSAWANDHRITWHDIRRWWNEPSVHLVPPFASVDLRNGVATENYPVHEPDPAQFGTITGAENWNAELTEAEWCEVTQFFTKFALLPRHMDFVEISVGREIRRIEISRRNRHARARGARFSVPKQSLLDAVASGYFDDLLIGNFMQVYLTNMRLYPHFTPLIAKIGGSAGVYTHAQYQTFFAHYFWRNPVGTITYVLKTFIYFGIWPKVGQAARALGLHSRIRRVLGQI